MKQAFKNILIVGGVHGDEPTGIQLARYFEHKREERITVLICHEQAILKKKRFLETDLNRSFGCIAPISLEEKLAKSLQKKVQGFDIVLDFHNTKASDTTCTIVTHQPTALDLAITKHFGLSKLVIMPPSGSLISTIATPAISIEIAQNDTKHFSLKKLVQEVITLDSLDNKTEGVEVYSFYNHVPAATLKRLKVSRHHLRNFIPLSTTQKKLFGIPESAIVCPIFYKYKQAEPVTCTLVKKLNTKNDHQTETTNKRGIA